jgi:type IV secretory pathway VirB10-like protein
MAEASDSSVPAGKADSTAPIKDGGKGSETPVAPRRRATKAEPIPLKWKVVGISGGFALTLLKTAEKSLAEGEMARLQQEGRYHKLGVYPIDAKISTPHPPKRMPEPPPRTKKKGAKPKPAAKAVPARKKASGKTAKAAAKPAAKKPAKTAGKTKAKPRSKPTKAAAAKAKSAKKPATKAAAKPKAKANKPKAKPKSKTAKRATKARKSPRSGKTKK